MGLFSSISCDHKYFVAFISLVSTNEYKPTLSVTFCTIHSVTRLGDLLHFEQLFKVFGNSYFAQIAHIYSTFL